MRWIEKKKQQLFYRGEKRVVKRFLWLPTKPMLSEEWRWLEYARIEQEWLVGHVLQWRDIGWEDEN